MKAAATAMVELVDNIGELTGVGSITKLIKLIIKAASTARKQNRVCRKFARWLQIMEGLLQPLLKAPKLMERPGTREVLELLEESLKQAYQLVIKYKDRSYPYRFIMGSDIAERFSDMRNDIKDCIDLIPLIKLFVDETITHRVDARCHDKDEEDQNREEGKNKMMGQKKGKGKMMGQKIREENMDQNKYWKNMDQNKYWKNGEEGKNRVKDIEKGKKGMEENEKVKDKRRYKGKEENDKEKNTGLGNKMEEWKEQNEKNKEKGRVKEKNTDKGNRQNEKEEIRTDKENDTGNNEKTAVLKVAMRCECNGCQSRINRTISKYKGVEKVVTKLVLDEGIASVTVVGHFDANMLRDYVAKETKKEVHLLGNKGRDRKDRRVLEKTDIKSIGDGGKLPKGGETIKKRVVPTMAAETVVLKVGDAGIRCECNGCVDKIRSTLFNITGVHKVGIDTDKNQVTVIGTNMDIKNLQEKLCKKVRRPVEVI